MVSEAQYDTTAMRFLLIFALYALASSGWAQSSAERPLSFAEAQALWQAHSRELALARSNAEMAAADVVTAGQIPNPQASMNVLSISPWSGYRAGGWRDKKMDTALRVDQVLERGGKRGLRVEAAEAAWAASRHDVDETARQQRLLLSAAYYDLLSTQERAGIAAQALVLYQKSMDAARLRFRAGDIAAVELSRLQVEVDRAANESRQLESEREKAQAALAYLIGREQAARYLVVADVWPEVGALPATAATLPATRPDLQAARQRVEAAEKARALARAQRTRDVTVGMQVEHNLQNAPTNSYGFGVSVPLFIWHEYEGEIARAEAELDAARQQLALSEAQAWGDVDQAGSVLRAASERRQRLENGLLKNAESVARAAEFAYAKGAMGVMDLLDARRTLRQVQIEAALAKAEHAKALAAWKLQAEFGK